uniref:Uncharacterized protein n=1 Tax=Rhizophora mucronata TaxID=61149 RepID=A0A2P2MX35_RHIMU
MWRAILSGARFEKVTYFAFLLPLLPIHVSIICKRRTCT